MLRFSRPRSDLQYSRYTFVELRQTQFFCYRDFTTSNTNDSWLILIHLKCSNSLVIESLATQFAASIIMSLLRSNSDARQPTHSLRYGAGTKLTKIAKDTREASTTRPATPAADRSSQSYRKRLSSQLSRLTSLRGNRRSTDLSEIRSAMLARAAVSRPQTSR